MFLVFISAQWLNFERYFIFEMDSCQYCPVFGWMVYSRPSHDTKLRNLQGQFFLEA